jgi:hypothetical protein
MQFRTFSISSALFAAVATVSIGQVASAQDAPARPAPAAAVPAATPTARAAKGFPARANAGEYLSRAQAGTMTIGAEFDEHTAPMSDATMLTTEDFVVVEVGLFGPAGAHAALSYSDFSLRINGKKAGLTVEPVAAVFRNLRDPQYSPPELAGAKPSKAGGLGTGAGGGQDGQPTEPVVVHIPPEMERAMQIKAQNASLPEGDRALPVAGILFFRYSGLRKGIHTIELVYTGPSGKATVTLQP